MSERGMQDERGVSYANGVCIAQGWTMTEKTETERALEEVMKQYPALKRMLSDAPPDALIERLRFLLGHADLVMEQRTDEEREASARDGVSTDKLRASMIAAHLWREGWIDRSKAG
jgi:hypothetical protein